MTRASDGRHGGAVLPTAPPRCPGSQPRVRQWTGDQPHHLAATPVRPPCRRSRTSASRATAAAAAQAGRPDPSGAGRQQVAQAGPESAAAAGRTVLTFGGAYSNHLRATAAAGRLLGLPTVGVVRGQELADRPLNPSLARCAATACGCTSSTVDVPSQDRPGDTGRAPPCRGRRGRVRRPRGRQQLPRRTRLSRARRANCAATPTSSPSPAAPAAPSPAWPRASPPASAPWASPSSGRLPRRPDIQALQHRAFGGPRGDWSLDDRFHFGGYARTTPELDAFAARLRAAPRPARRTSLCRQVAVRTCRPRRGGRLSPGDDRRGSDHRSAVHHLNPPLPEGGDSWLRPLSGAALRDEQAHRDEQQRRHRRTTAARRRCPRPATAGATHAWSRSPSSSAQVSARPS